MRRTIIFARWIIPQHNFICLSLGDLSLVDVVVLLLFVGTSQIKVANALYKLLKELQIQEVTITTHLTPSLILNSMFVVLI